MLEIIFNNREIEAENVKVIGIVENVKFKLQDYQKIFSKKESQLLEKVLARNSFTGKFAEFLEIESEDCKILCMGMGKNITQLKLQKLGQDLAKKLFKDEAAVIYAHEIKSAKITQEEMAHNLAFGMEVGSYEFDKYFTKKKVDEYSSLEKVIFVAEKGVVELDDFTEYAALANGIRYAKDLGNEPSNYLTPEAFACDVKRLEYLGLEVEILDRKKLEEENFKLVLAVGKGSVNEPKVAVLKWIGDKEKDYFDIALVGKGVTYDSGGITLKTDPQQLDMKFDMCGAAAVVAAMKVIALQKQMVNAVAVVGLVENMPNGDAYKPDDVFGSMSGQTIEIIDTDGEGRLILADCLWYAQEKFEVKKIIDIATLTGTVAYALAGQFAGLYSNDDKLAQELIKKGEACGEKLWRLPITEEFDKWINSRVADMKNIGRKEGDGSQAACLLQRFVKPDVKWAHIDMAACELDEEHMATGFGTRILVEAIKGLK